MKMTTEKPATGISSDRIAVICPGIGYHKDKPLLYYSAKILQAKGYEVLHVEYRDMPRKIRGNAEMMEKAAEIAYEQTQDQLESVGFAGYNDVIFIGKSIGTVAMARYISEHRLRGRQIWYTPVEATFSFPSEDVIAFIGDEDPWSDVSRIKQMAGEYDIVLYSYPGCNHSLECDNVDTNITNLRDVMKKSEEFIEKK